MNVKPRRAWHRSGSTAKVQPAHVSTSTRRTMNKRTSIMWSMVILAVGVGLVILFFRADRHGQISAAIRAWGPAAALAAILLMAAFCIIPVPSEFLMIMNMKVFGVWWGIFYTWIGAMIGALAVFLMARHVGRRLLDAFVTPERMEQVDGWIREKGALGLLLARLVPLPFIVVNYGAGIMDSISIWEYTWTTGVGLLPYDLGAALLFIGVSHRFIWWLVIGAGAVLAVWLVGYLFNRHVNRLQRWAH